MTLAEVVDRASERQKTLVVYGPEETDVAEQFATRNVVVEYRPLPTEDDDPFVVVREESEFDAALALDDLRTFLAPPIRRPGTLDDLDPAYRAIFDLFDDTVFASLDRRQLLATVREFEDRALRTGAGRLHVGFQRLSAFEEQRELYHHLAEHTDLDVHVHGAFESDPEADSDGQITVHHDRPEDVDRYWFFVYDGGEDDAHACALIAEEREPGAFYGTWTYAPDLVADAFEALE